MVSFRIQLPLLVLAAVALESTSASYYTAKERNCTTAESDKVLADFKQFEEMMTKCESTKPEDQSAYICPKLAKFKPLVEALPTCKCEEENKTQTELLKKIAEMDTKYKCPTNVYERQCSAEESAQINNDTMTFKKAIRKCENTYDKEKQNACICPEYFKVEKVIKAIPECIHDGYLMNRTQLMVELQQDASEYKCTEAEKQTFTSSTYHNATSTQCAAEETTKYTKRTEKFKKTLKKCEDTYAADKERECICEEYTEMAAFLRTLSTCEVDGKERNPDSLLKQLKGEAKKYKCRSKTKPTYHSNAALDESASSSINFGAIVAVAMSLIGAIAMM